MPIINSIVNYIGLNKSFDSRKIFPIHYHEYFPCHSDTYLHINFNSKRFEQNNNVAIFCTAAKTQASYIELHYPKTCFFIIFNSLELIQLIRIFYTASFRVSFTKKWKVMVAINKIPDITPKTCTYSKFVSRKPVSIGPDACPISHRLPNTPIEVP